MDLLLLNPITSYGKSLARSYSGGYGDVMIDTENSEDLLFPPLELLRMAGITRAAGMAPVVVDQQADPASALPERADAVIVSASLPSLPQDTDTVRALAETGRYGQCYLYMSVMEAGIWRDTLLRMPGVTIMTPSSLTAVDRILRGESRLGLVSLADGGTLVHDPTPAWEPLDSEPLPARDLLPHDAYCFKPLEHGGGVSRGITTANASFGCPFPCGYYCPYPLAEGRNYRDYPIDRLVEEFAQAERLGITGIVFRDPVFTHDMRRTAELCRRLIAVGSRMPWWCETRINRTTPELLALMYEAGCRGIEVGVESGDDGILATTARKNLKLSEVREFRDVVEALGLHVCYLFMVGHPGERRVHVANTLRFVLDLGVDENQFNVATITPYPGTRLAAEAAEKGWTEAPTTSFSSYTPVMHTDTLSADDLQDAGDLAERLRILLSERTHSGGDKARDAFLSDLEKWVESGG